MMPEPNFFTGVGIAFFGIFGYVLFYKWKRSRE